MFLVFVGTAISPYLLINLVILIIKIINFLFSSYTVDRYSRPATKSPGKISNSQ